jgi:leucyl aminopeptidase
MRSACSLLQPLGSVQAEAVRAAVTACSDASYTYTTTKSKAGPAKLRACGHCRQ